MNIQIIPATEADREFFRQAHHLSYGGVIESMFGWNEVQQDKYADADFEARNPHLILYDEARIGVIGWQNKVDHIWFGPIFILPEHQGKGIGSHLVKQFMAKANAKNLPLRLQTLRQNAGAKRFYEKLEFKVLSSSNIHWQMEYLSDAGPLFLVTVYVDGDACPVKAEVVRVASRYSLKVYMVSNQGLRANFGVNVRGIMVGPEFDAADNWIVDHLAVNDIVITADIQLAARCLQKGAKTINPTGKIFTDDNIGSALAMRELSSYLREAGEIKGNNPAFSKQDRSQFLQSLDGIIQNIFNK